MRNVLRMYPCGYEIAGKYRTVRCLDAVHEMRAAGGRYLRSDSRSDAVYPDPQHPSARAASDNGLDRTRYEDAAYRRDVAMNQLHYIS